MPGATHPKKKAKVDGVDDAEASGVGTRMIFGRVARDWTVDENQFIYDHLQSCVDKTYLSKQLGRNPSSVAKRVKDILAAAAQKFPGTSSPAVPAGTSSSGATSLAGKKRARPSKSKPATSKAVKDKSKGEDDEAEGAVNESS
ncbi:uncharacterized protein PFL1_03746 [Pseudozyma flocculosa PF-1]|uniref:Uncharacterized protein n=1 Tax=Pseudozyma flocculosa PF-1 TaxID=1277687 RepID=A0A061HEB3_9BASI|nr:uncharacterized protein PFL1_03746 [Pseudozyma flocculosa PF-1]EPQ28946.1 hypothetical protein PFL1_03746 [Pseudozyma flocculosa PF-1]